MQLTAEERATMDHNAQLEEYRDWIMRIAHASKYDHRTWMAAEVGLKFPHMMLENQLLYARFKLAVAMVLKPTTVYEVGVGWGVAANAFIQGCTTTRYFGIENVADGIHPSVVLPPTAAYQVVASDDLPAFVHPNGPIDLLHLDGGHGYDQKIRDVEKALAAKPEWLLIDDVHDVMVARGTFEGLWRAARNPLKMIYFENSHTSSLLVHVRRQEPEYRHQ